MIPHKHSNRRHFLLLEVLIAVFLLMMALGPLIAPHLMILSQQRKFITQMEQIHLVKLLYVNILEKLYTNQIGWDRVTGGEMQSIDGSLLEEVGYKGASRLSGSYHFRVVKSKPAQVDAPYRVYLMELEFVMNGNQQKGPFSVADTTSKYGYQIVMVYDRNSGELPAGDTTGADATQGAQSTP